MFFLHKWKKNLESDIDCMEDGIVVTHWIPIPAPPEVKQ